ncbi:hypothetical protein D043_0915, partial [Vibrio parahaemolyticus EKP-021]
MNNKKAPTQTSEKSCVGASFAFLCKSIR